MTCISFRTLDLGNALTLIRDCRLYRADYKTFEAYCRLKWQFGKAYAYRLISAAEVVAHLSTIGDTALPENEAQVRPLIGLTPEQVRKVWIEAVSDGERKPVTARAVNEKASRYRDQERPKTAQSIRRKTQSNIGAADMQDVTNTVIQLEQAVRRGAVSETIFGLLSKLKASVVGLTDIFEMQRSKQKR